MSITPIQESSFTQGYLNNSFKREQEIKTQLQIEEENHIKDEDDSKLIENRNLSNEETKNLYLAYQTNNLMKTKLEIYMKIEQNEELEYKNIREMQKAENRIDVITHYNNQSYRPKDEYEVWA